MSAAMPRSGGDYVFVGRSTWPWLGFLANWMMTLSLFVLLGIISVSTITLGLGPSLTALAYVTGNASLANFSNTIQNDHTAEILIAIALVGLVCFIALMGDRWVKIAFRALIVIGSIGLVIMLAVLLATDHARFLAQLNPVLQAHGEGTIGSIRAAADKAGFHPVPFSLGPTLAALPYGFFTYVGVTYTTYLGGEIQRPQRSQPLGMLIAFLIAAVVYTIFFAGGYRMIGADNVHAWAYLMNNKPAALTFPGGPFLSFFLGVAANNALLSFLIGLSFLAWFLMILLFSVIMPVRNMFAWSMDRILPEAVAAVTPRGTPYVATAITVIGAIGITFAAVYTSIFSLFVNYTLMYAITFLIAGFGAAVFPYTRPDLFNNAPEVTRRRLFGIPIVTIAGIVQVLVFIDIIQESLKTPAFGGPVGTVALALIAAMIVLGPIVFFVSRAIRSQQGVDMDAAWRTLPPD
jgi:APA family basic amino acid/polyamine antiporter